MVVEIENYIDNILKKQLLQFGINNNKLILDNVKKQVYSLLSHWNDKELRNTILLTGLEEGNYYLSDANILIKSFVVVAIRNSYIESLGSQFYKEYNFDRQISDDEIKVITSKAISYFKDLNLSILATKINLSKDEDYYLNTIKEYPNSYQILNILANMNKNEMYFERIEVKKCSNIFIHCINITKNQDEAVIEDGYNSEIGSDLINAIQISYSQNYPFITLSFKYITRNFNKLLRVIQLLLECNIPLVSSNYYISNGYVARRNKLIRVAHTKKEREVCIRNITGLSKKHAKAINEARKEHFI